MTLHDMLVNSDNLKQTNILIMMKKRKHRNSFGYSLQKRNKRQPTRQTIVIHVCTFVQNEPRFSQDTQPHTITISSTHARQATVQCLPAGLDLLSNVQGIRFRSQVHPSKHHCHRYSVSTAWNCSLIQHTDSPNKLVISMGHAVQLIGFDDD